MISVKFMFSLLISSACTGTEGTPLVVLNVDEYGRPTAIAQLV
jgi:hypothetical protein